MLNRVILISNLEDAKRELTSIGVEPIAVEIMAPKAVFRAVKVKDIKAVAANIIKQEMLAIGGEAAAAYGALNQSIEKTDVLILGTLKHFRLFTAKLKQHQFGLPQIAGEIETILQYYDYVPRPMTIGQQLFDFAKRTYIMGILNVTPDSFSDGGKYSDLNSAINHAEQMAAEGADIIDIGGESTRPGSERISAEEEIDRVVPVIEKLIHKISIPLSIDTTKAEVAAAALSAGAAMVNDISGLRFDPKMPELVAQAKVPICLMHIQGTPQNMQVNPSYSDLMGEIIGYLQEGLAIAKRAGILHEQIIIDPGIGFGKTVEQNLEIVKKLCELKVLGCPILVGPSRKSVIGKVLDLPVEDRLEGTLAMVALSAANGANIVRVHDVKAAKRTVKMVEAIVRRK
ncbi:MAG: dihydropteroate synthase [Candidatus Margulisbacteria bacterium]|nr:dihydropteroate synthase [Candidatus Margulisiibacteriota bacterium]